MQRLPRERIFIVDVDIINPHLAHPRVEVRHGMQYIRLGRDMEAAILAQYYENLRSHRSRTGKPPGCVKAGGEINQD